MKTRMVLDADLYAIVCAKGLLEVKKEMKKIFPKKRNQDFGKLTNAEMEALINAAQELPDQ